MTPAVYAYWLHAFRTSSTGGHAHAPPQQDRQEQVSPMPWFRMDDKFHSHPKVIAAGNEAIGLFTRCGTYAAEHLTDGFIPEHVVPLYGSPALAETLVRSKLWRRARGGWRMPDYLDYNPSREQVCGSARRLPNGSAVTGPLPRRDTTETCRLTVSLTFRLTLWKTARASTQNCKPPGHPRFCHAVTNGVTNGVSHGCPDPAPTPSRGRPPKTPRSHGNLASPEPRTDRNPSRSTSTHTDARYRSSAIAQQVSAHRDNESAIDSPSTPAASSAPAASSPST